MPPAGFEKLQLQNRFENKKRGKVATGHFAFRDSSFAIGVAFEGAPKLARAINRRGRTENEYAIDAVFLEGFEVIGCQVTFKPGKRSARDEDGVGSADGQKNARGETLGRRRGEWAVRVAGKCVPGRAPRRRVVGAGFSRRASTRVDAYAGSRGSRRR